MIGSEAARAPQVVLCQSLFILVYKFEKVATTTASLVSALLQLVPYLLLNSAIVSPQILTPFSISSEVK